MIRDPKVSVVCVTYNQEKYVSKAIESFLMQEHTFPIEIIIVDDCSNDGTKKIISTYAKTHPSIAAHFNKTNLGVVDNFYKALRLARGKYIALCEGDDFWTDKTKLQAQADFLDYHEDYTVCFHPVKVQYEGKISEQTLYPTGDKKRYTSKRLLTENFIQTNSVMYRRLDYSVKPPSDILPIDWYLHQYHAKYGKVGFIDKPMAAYRKHAGGVWWVTPENKHRFWMNNAIRHMDMHVAVLSLYADSPKLQTFASQAAVRTLRDILGVTGHYDDDELAGKMLRRYPDLFMKALLCDEKELTVLREAQAEMKASLQLSHEEARHLKDTNKILQAEAKRHADAYAEVTGSKLWRYTSKARRIKERTRKGLHRRLK